MNPNAFANPEEQGERHGAKDRGENRRNTKEHGENPEEHGCIRKTRSNPKLERVKYDKILVFKGDGDRTMNTHLGRGCVLAKNMSHGPLTDLDHIANTLRLITRGRSLSQTMLDLKMKNPTGTMTH